MPRYTAGQLVTIYQKPLTLDEPEGRARLIRFLEAEPVAGGTLETWRVQFPEDGLRCYTRRILYTVQRNAI